MLDEYYFHLYKSGGVTKLEESGLCDQEIVQVLGTYCISRECITPVLKQSGWSLERFEQAQRSWGATSDFLEELIGDFKCLDQVEYHSMTPPDLYDHICRTRR